MSSDEQRTLRFQVRGRVQGVGFRWWTQSRARELGVAGTVRNLADGTVEVIASGSQSVLATLERELHAGPPAANVEQVSRTQTDERPLEGFTIVG